MGCNLNVYSNVKVLEVTLLEVARFNNHLFELTNPPSKHKTFCNNTISHLQNSYGTASSGMEGAESF